jgi:hypothetical protein
MTSTTTYEAAISCDLRHLTIIKNIPAGISGPFAHIEFDGESELPTELTEYADEILFKHGFLTAGYWTKHTNGHFATVTKMF